MPTENRSSNSEGVSELLPCPFCKAAMRIESNRDWHRVMGEHDDECVFMDPETMMVPATDEQRELLVRDWNRRAQPAQQHQGEQVAPWYYYANCADPDYSCLFHHENEAQTQVADHGGTLEKLWNVPPHADAGEVERLTRKCQNADLALSAQTENCERLRAELEAEKKQHAQVLELATRRWNHIARLESQLAERDALLRQHSGKLIVLAARLLQEPLRVLNGDLDSNGPITRIKVTDGVERAGDSLGGLAVEVRRVADDLSASAAPIAPIEAVPDGYCIMPRQLTAENGAKALLLGEFKLEVTRECPECLDLDEPAEGCEICDGAGEYGQRHTIPWEQIKFIYSEAVKGLALKPQASSDCKS